MKLSIKNRLFASFAGLPLLLTGIFAYALDLSIGGPDADDAAFKTQEVA